MAKGLCIPKHLYTRLLDIIPFQNHELNMEFIPPFSYNSLPSSGKIFHKSVSAENLYLFSQKNYSDVRHWCWMRKYGLHSELQLIPKGFNRVEVRTPCSLLGFLHTRLVKPCLYWPDFVHRGTVMLKQGKGFSIHSRATLFYTQCIPNIYL